MGKGDVPWEQPPYRFPEENGDKAAKGGLLPVSDRLHPKSGLKHFKMDLTRIRRLRRFYMERPQLTSRDWTAPTERKAFGAPPEPSRTRQVLLVGAGFWAGFTAGQFSSALFRRLAAVGTSAPQTYGALADAISGRALRYVVAPIAGLIAYIEDSPYMAGVSAGVGAAGTIAHWRGDLSMVGNIVRDAYSHLKREFTALGRDTWNLFGSPTPGWQGPTRYGHLTTADRLGLFGL